MLTYKLPTRVFKKKLDYLKYKLGFLKLPQIELLGAVTTILGKELGLSKIHKILRYGNDFPKIFAYEGQHEEFTIFGSDLNSYEVAWSKMIGEFLERKVFKCKLFSGFEAKLSIQELKNLYKISLVSDFHKYDEINLRLNPKTKVDLNQKILATQVEDLINQRKVFYPSQCIFYSKLEETENFRIGPRNSNGCAGGFTVEKVTISGICEIVERDAFLLHWLLEIPCRQIIVDEIHFPEYFIKIMEMKRYGFELKFFDITTDLGIPTVLTTIEDILSDEKKLSLTAACALSFSEALQKSLIEACVVSVTFTDNNKWDDVYNLIKVGEFQKSISSEYRSKILYKENAGRIKFISSGENVDLLQLDLQKPKLSLEIILDLLRQKNFHVYRFVSRAGILKELGYQCVRVVIPELLPYYMEENLSMNNSTRIENFLKFKGISRSKLNSFPHPFP